MKSKDQDMAIATIKIEDIRNKVEQLSSYEGRNAYTPSGEADFENVHTTQQDADWLNSFAIEAGNNLITLLSPLANDSTITDDTISLDGSLINSVRASKGPASRMCFEAITAYVMRQWCSEHKPARVEFYNNMWTDLCASINTLIINLTCPQKHRRPSYKEQVSITVSHE